MAQQKETHTPAIIYTAPFLQQTRSVRPLFRRRVAYRPTFYNKRSHWLLLGEVTHAAWLF